MMSRYQKGKLSKVELSKFDNCLGDIATVGDEELCSKPRKRHFN